MIGSPPIPIAVEIPSPALTIWSAASYVSVPDFETIPTLPFRNTNPGMMPTLASPGVITPGQFGPTSTTSPFSLMTFLTIIISLTGIPSVMATITRMPESAASRMASAANAGGTKTMDTSAPVLSTASRSVLNTGLPRCSAPPLPGVTPPTTLVPYSIICPEWKVPSDPVNPCTTTLESLFTNTLMWRLDCGSTKIEHKRFQPKIECVNED